MAYTSKRCPTCGIDKALDMFPRHRSRADGHGVHCKTCQSARLRAYRATPAGRKATNESWERSRDKARQLFLRDTVGDASGQVPATA